MEIVRLDEAEEAQEFGNKAVGLSMLIKHGIEVPDGFAIGCRLAHNAEAWGEDVRRVVGRHLERIGTPVAVRSSATDEDSVGASFAGQYLTLLNLVGEDDVVHAILRVARSGSDASPSEYRRKLGVSGNAKVAVIVQRLVDADSAGVCFTIDPITGRDECLISASWGLGEAVVQGVVVPDNIRVARNGVILQYDVGHKEIEFRRSEGAGTETRRVAVERVASPCLTSAQVLVLVDAARRSERIHARPVDLEWAYWRSKLFILQCRPVTARPSRSTKREPGGE